MFGRRETDRNEKETSGSYRNITIRAAMTFFIKTPFWFIWTADRGPTFFAIPIL